MTKQERLDTVTTNHKAVYATMKLLKSDFKHLKLELRRLEKIGKLYKRTMNDLREELYKEHQ